ALAGLGGGLAHQGGARELVAVVAGAAHQQVWRSGDEASSWRSAFSISAGYCSFFHCAVAFARERRVKRLSSLRVCAVIAGLPRKVSARLISFAASSGRRALSLSSSCRRVAGVGILLRTRNGAGSCRGGASQP